MSVKFLDTNGLIYVWSKIKTYVTGFVGTATPSMDGSASTGSSSKYAREDHVHPTDTGRAPVAHASSANTYGVGSGTNYGHLKLSDATNGSSDKDGAIAATPKAVADALSAAKTYAVPASTVGAASGVCPLNSSSKIDNTYLPSYVDDVIEAYPVGSTELASDWLAVTAGGTAFTPETGKIYVLMAASTNYSANTQFRWGGSAYVKLADGGVTAITNAEIDAIFAS